MILLFYNAILIPCNAMINKIILSSKIQGVLLDKNNNKNETYNK